MHRHLQFQDNRLSERWQVPYYRYLNHFHPLNNISEIHVQTKRRVGILFLQDAQITGQDILKGHFSD